MSIEEWLLTRPECVQNLAREFPFGTVLQGVDGLGPLYLIGYTENDSLILSETNPDDDYDTAIETKIYICAEYLRTKEKS